LIISRTKQRLSFVVAFARVLSWFLMRILHRSIQALDRSITHRVMAGTNPDFPWAAFSCTVLHPIAAAKRKALAQGFCSQSVQILSFTKLGFTCWPIKAFMFVGSLCMVDSALLKQEFFYRTDEPRSHCRTDNLP